MGAREELRSRLTENLPKGNKAGSINPLRLARNKAEQDPRGIETTGGEADNIDALRPMQAFLILTYPQTQE